MSTELDALRDFILERNPAVGNLDLDLDLIDTRAVDSLAFLDFVLLLEKLSGQPIPAEEIDLEDFRTLRRIDERFLTAKEVA